VKVRVEGRLIFNAIGMILNAALAGSGLACLPEDLVHAHLVDGELIRVLDEWCRPFPGYHLYYPSRRHVTPAFTAVVEALRYSRPKAESAGSR
jgi:DNA-binding transcriptional LysR family regulator